MSDDRTDAPRPDPARPAFVDGRRRGLLQGAAVALAAGAGGVAAAARADVADGADVTGAASAGAVPAADAGYRVTDHVREYYAKARF